LQKWLLEKQRSLAGNEKTITSCLSCGAAIEAIYKFCPTCGDPAKCVRCITAATFADLDDVTQNYLTLERMEMLEFERSRYGVSAKTLIGTLLVAKLRGIRPEKRLNVYA